MLMISIDGALIVGKGENAGYKKRRETAECFLVKLSLKLEIFPLFLAHLSTTCSGGAIVTGHLPASVRPSICPSVH